MEQTVQLANKISSIIQLLKTVQLVLKGNHTIHFKNNVNN